MGCGSGVNGLKLTFFKIIRICSFWDHYSNDGDSKWSPCKWMKDAFCLWWLGDMHWEWASSPLQESNSDLLTANFWMLYHWGVGNMWDLEPWTMYAWVAILLFFCTARLKLSINCVQLIWQQMCCTITIPTWGWLRNISWFIQFNVFNEAIFLLNATVILVD